MTTGIDPLIRALHGLAAEGGGPLSDIGAARAARAVQALATPTRLAIIQQVRPGPLPAHDIASAIGDDPTWVAHELGELVAAEMLAITPTDNESEAALYGLSRRGEATLPILELAGLPLPPD